MTISAKDLLVDAFNRAHDQLPSLLGDLNREALEWRPDPDANSIGWLAWHLARVEDDHVAGVGEVEQVYTRDGFAALFALPYPTEAHGYGMTRADVDAFTVEGPGLLVDYYNAVHSQTLAVLAGMDDTDWSRIVDRHFTPPVTAAVRLVSVVNDVFQHMGQIGYVKGLAARPR